MHPRDRRCQRWHFRLGASIARAPLPLSAFQSRWCRDGCGPAVCRALRVGVKQALEGDRPALLAWRGAGRGAGRWTALASVPDPRARRFGSRPI